MPEPLRCVSPRSVITGWDFGTTGMKCLIMDAQGNVLDDIRLPAEQWTEGGVAELNLMQLEGQARSSVRAVADRLRKLNRLDDWVAGGISATHHSAGRIDACHNQVRRAICWNDESLTKYHAAGLARLGGQDRVVERIGGPWARRYSLSHLVKDEECLPLADWQRTAKILPHGSLVAGYLTGDFDQVSVSAAASTGIMDLRTNQWCPAMLDALASPVYRQLAAHQLPRIATDMNVPIGPLADHVALEAGIALDRRPLFFPTSDDQAAGLVGGGAVNAGQLAIILGTSAVVNSSAADLPKNSPLDAMKLNWGPYLLMRCYNNGAQFIDSVVGKNADFRVLEAAAARVPPGCDGVSVLPFLYSEPSRGITKPCLQWLPAEPSEPGVRFRAALEALAYLIAQGVLEHIDAGQKITRITVAGGSARSRLMCEILASVLNLDVPLTLIEPNEGSALGAAVTALAAVEQHSRRQQGVGALFGVADAAEILVRFPATVAANPAWAVPYADGLRQFQERVRGLSAAS